MPLQARLEPVWDPAEVEQVLRAALDLVAALEAPDELAPAVFQAGVNLLSMRAVQQSPALGFGLAPAGVARP